MTDTTQLIQKLRAQDPDGLALLYEAYGKPIYNLAYRMTGNPEEAEDITQETFLQVYRNIDTFREQSQLYTWIYTITKNLCYQSFRRVKKSSFATLETLIHQVADSQSLADIEEWEKQHLIGQVKEGCLTGLLRCLSFNQRIAFILHVLLRFSHRDVARILDKSEDATKVLIHRARKNLRTFLCKNCSVYDPTNPCHCENLIGFSLKQGWINPPTKDQKALLDSRQIEEEIRGIREVVELYNELPESDPTKNLVQRIKTLVQSQEGVIFTRTKV